MTKIDPTELSTEIATEIGPDVVHVRPPAVRPGDRLYLTGLEIAIGLGTVLVVNFCLGLVRGVGNRLGERLGRAGADALIKKVEQLAEKQQSQFDQRLTGESLPTSAALESELAALLNDDLSRLLRQDPTLLDDDLKNAIRTHVARLS